MSSSSQRVGVIPACLSFLAIYSPALGRSEDNLDEQIVYYYSKPAGHGTEKGSNDAAQDAQSGEEKNKRLRQIGLAQGMVEFAKSFSNGEALDSIETEKSRIILHELEEGWWILASIDLTRLISYHSSSSGASEGPHVEYSAREVSSPALLLQHLLRAHQIFLLHHASSLAEMFLRTARSKFCNILKRFWNDFIWNWDVLLSGNPAVDVFNGIKLAAGGELGVGVGEEDWGSGEREVLEDFIRRTEGLVDLLVARFGDVQAEKEAAKTTSMQTQANNGSETKEWEGTGHSPHPSDGIIFSGVGAISRLSTRAISHWAETLYTRGQDAYGVRINPTSAHRRRRPGVAQELTVATSRNKALHRQHSPKELSSSINATGPGSIKDDELPAGIPPSLMGPLRSPHRSAGTTHGSDAANINGQVETDVVADDGETGTETMIKYLTLGVFGSKWGIPFNRPPTSRQISNLGEKNDADPGTNDDGSFSTRLAAHHFISPGDFLVGFRGELEGELEDDVELESGTEPGNRVHEQSTTSRTMVRTLHVERMKPLAVATNSTTIGKDSALESQPDRLRVIVYIRQPFFFVFLFELQTEALAMPSFYRSIHHQLGPLQRPLLVSTSPDKVFERLSEASLPKSTAATKSSQPICDLVYDPSRLTVHTTIPNIPEPSNPAGQSVEKPDAMWSRVEALNVHLQVLNTLASTRRRPSELERTCKTSRGWWVVWMRLPHGAEPPNTNLCREAFLIRKASDHSPPAARNSTGRLGRDLGGSSASGSWTPGNLAEGIGIDARQYIDGLLSLNR